MRTIKMMASNPQTRRWEEVFPEDEVSIEEMTPLFWSARHSRWVSIPGVEAADEIDEWEEQLRKFG